MQNVSQNNTMNEGAKAFYDEEKKHFCLFEKNRKTIVNEYGNLYTDRTEY